MQPIAVGRDYPAVQGLFRACVGVAGRARLGGAARLALIGLSAFAGGCDECDEADFEPRCGSGVVEFCNSAVQAAFGEATYIDEQRCPSEAPTCIEGSAGPVCLGEVRDSCETLGFVRCADASTAVLCIPDEEGQPVESWGSCDEDQACEEPGYIQDGPTLYGHPGGCFPWRGTVWQSMPRENRRPVMMDDTREPIERLQEAKGLRSSRSLSPVPAATTFLGTGAG